MSTPRRGLTIIELMVSLGVIAVVMAILLPALAGVKRNALELAALAHQHQTGMLVRQHAHERNEEFPFFGLPGTEDALLCLMPDHVYYAGAAEPGDTEPVCITVDYWRQPRYWMNHMKFLGYEIDFAAKPPELRPDAVGLLLFRSIDQMTYGAYAPPHFWRPDDPQSPRDHNVQKWTSVTYPSRKVILQRSNFVRDEEGDDATRPVLSWFADGHGEPMRKIDMLPAVPLRLRVIGGFRGLTTLGGLDGRDK